MTMFTGWTGWLIFITALIAAWLLCATAIAATWHLAKCAYLRRLGIHVGAPQDDLYSYGDRLIRTLNQEAERLYPDGDDNQAWPPDLCSAPACSPEDGGVCDHHMRLGYGPAAERVGRHRAVWQGSLDDQPATVIFQAVTDVPYRRRPR